MRRVLLGVVALGDDAVKELSSCDQLQHDVPMEKKIAGEKWMSVYTYVCV